MTHNLTLARLKFIKKELRPIFPLIPSAKLTEMIAHGYYYKSHSSLLNALKKEMKIPLYDILKSDFYNNITDCSIKDNILSILNKSQDININIADIVKYYYKNSIHNLIDKQYYKTTSFIYNNNEYFLLWNSINCKPLNNLKELTSLYLSNNIFHLLYQEYIKLLTLGYSPIKIINMILNNEVPCLIDILSNKDMTFIIHCIDENLRKGQDFITAISPFVNPYIMALYRICDSILLYPIILRYQNRIVDYILSNQLDNKAILFYIDLFNIVFLYHYKDNDKDYIGNIYLYKKIASLYNIDILDVILYCNPRYQDKLNYDILKIKFNEYINNKNNKTIESFLYFIFN